MILAIGFRVKSIRGTQFRKWANQNLIKTIEYMEKKEEKKLHYLLIGYANSKTLEDSKRQWKEILEHINLELDKAREEILGEVLSKGRDLSVLHLAPHIPVSDVEEILSKLKDNK